MCQVPCDSRVTCVSNAHAIMLLQDKNVAKQSEIEVKCATDMVEGRLDMLKENILKDFKEEEIEEEGGAGSFGIFTSPKPGTATTASESSRGAGAAAQAKRGSRNKPSAGSDPRVIGARIRKDTVKMFTSGQVLLDKALNSGEEMKKRILELHDGSEEHAMAVDGFKTVKLRLQCLRLLKDDRRGHQCQDVGAEVVELLKADPHFASQNIKADRVQTVGYMNFVRSTLFEMCRTGEACSELGDKHKD